MNETKRGDIRWVTLALDLIGGEGSELLSHVLADRVLECAQCRIHFEWVVGGKGEEKSEGTQRGVALGIFLSVTITVPGTLVTKRKGATQSESNPIALASLRLASPPSFPNGLFFRRERGDEEVTAQDHCKSAQEKNMEEGRQKGEGMRETGDGRELGQ